MVRLVPTALALTLCLARAASAQPALSPEGRWAVTTGEAEFEVQLCGADGTALCAALVSLSPAASTPETTPYLGNRLVDEAILVAPNVWAGLVDVAGQTLSGSARMVDADTAEVAGCLYLVACRGVTLTRK